MTMQIALQLWTVRELAERDIIGTLAEVARIGYRAVEFAGFGRASTARIRQALDESGLTAVSAHVPFGDLTTRRDQAIERLHALGCRRAVLPWIPPEYRAPLDEVRRLAAICEDIAGALANAGIEFAYHNEDYDFLPLGDTTLWHALTDNTNPRLVQLQLDVFTAQLMHAGPLELIHAAGERITSLHICDMSNRAYVPVGTGELDWPSLLAAARATAAEWLIVEQDAPAHPIEDAATSLRNLTALLAT